MKRQLMDKLILWKNKEDRKPLILSGARQVGKTWLMLEFGKTQFKNTAYISFFNNKRLKQVFDNDFNVERLISNLSIEANTKILPKETLIILDEIQECPRALEALKFFCEQANDYYIVAAGSLLGVFIHNNISFPVGKVDEMTLYPLNFLEYLEAMDEEKLINLLHNKNIDLINDNSEKFINHLKNYYYVGGMPEVVYNFAKHQDYNLVREKQNIIINQYASDFSKHISSLQLTRVNQIWNSIPIQLSNENKKFMFNKINKGARFKDFELAIEWLKKSGLINVVYRTKAIKLPLKSYMDLSQFKIFSVDIGLLSAMSELNKKTLLEDNNLFIEFKGSLAEQFVCQQLISMFNLNLYYYISDNNMYENDFIFSKDGEIFPVEVKSGKNVLSKSLKNYNKTFNPDKMYRFSLLNYKIDNNLINIPLYAISLMY